MATTDNDSFDLAAECVAEQINDELGNESVMEGSTIDVSGLEDCDCIPLTVEDCRQRRWHFVASHMLPYTREIAATYRSE